MQPTVGVCIVTFNQETFIAQCIESVLNQKSDYPVRMFIGNDASTDGTLAVCRFYQELYPGMVEIIRHEKNLGVVGNTMQVLKRIMNADCDYVAMLDGDDYWTDPLKISKQVGFLEMNTDYGFVHTRIRGQRIRFICSDRIQIFTIFFRQKSAFLPVCNFQMKSTVWFVRG